jgi:hypothetical protein
LKFHIIAAVPGEGEKVKITLGSRLQSRVCTTQIIVVKAPEADVDLRCGGKPMTDLTEVVDVSAGPVAGFDGGTAIGKRYVVSGAPVALELVVTRAGAGSLALGEIPLVEKEASPLPSSD